MQKESIVSAGKSSSFVFAAAYVTCVTSLIALIFLVLAWELWLAPLKPGGSALAWKVIPLLVPLLGILRGRLYTYRWTSMLIVFYFAEGLVRAYSDSGLSAKLAIAEIVLCSLFFAGSVSFIRWTPREGRAHDA